MSSEPAKPLPYAHKGDLTTGAVKDHLIRMTVPMIWGLLAVISVQLADIYFISLMNDTDILAGISFTFPVTMLISHLVFGINVALASVVSRLIGAQDHQSVKRVVLHGLMLAFSASAIIAAITYSLLEPLFTLLGADANTYPAIADYMPLWLLGSVILSLPVNANSAMRAAGDTRIPAFIMIVIAIVNFILDPILIFGWFGLPALGVFGAALATFVAYCLGAIMALYILISRKHLIVLDGWHLDQFKNSMARLLPIAIPAGIANIIMPATSAVVVALLAPYGSAAVAAYGIATRVEAMAMLIIIALAIGMAPIIGQNWGAGQKERVHTTMRLAILFNLGWSAFAALVLAIGAKPISSAFSADPAVIDLAMLFFLIVPFSYGIGNLVFGWSAFFNAIGQPQRAFFMIAAKSFLMIIPAVYIGGWLYGAIGIFIALAATNILSGILFHELSRRYFQG